MTQMTKQDFVKAFQNRYGGHLCVSDDVVGKFYSSHYKLYRLVKRLSDSEIMVLCEDYILSLGLQEEVVL